MSNKQTRRENDLAKIVADVADKWIENIDELIIDLAQYYGYVVSKAAGQRRRKKRRSVTYVLIGRKDQARGFCLTGKKGYRRIMEWETQFEGHDLEVKLEFKTTNGYLASIIFDVYNGFIANVDHFIRDLARHYGYEIKKKIRRREGRRA